MERQEEQLGLLARVFKRVDNTVRGVANGMTGGLADNAAAAADAVITGNYQDNLQQEHCKDATAGKEYVAGMAAGIGLSMGKIGEVAGFAVKATPFLKVPTRGIYREELLAALKEIEDFKKISVGGGELVNPPTIAQWHSRLVDREATAALASGLGMGGFAGASSLANVEAILKPDTPACQTGQKEKTVKR